MEMRQVVPTEWMTMCKEKDMRCPHCRNVGACVWVGYGKDWVICQFCQRRIRWTEVQAKYLVEDGDSWQPSQKAAAYH
jgi:hypothetical protein